MTSSHRIPAITPSKPIVVGAHTSSNGVRAISEQIAVPKVVSSKSQSIVSPFSASGGSNVSLQAQNPSSLLRQLIPGASLPEELNGIYRIKRLDSVQKHAWIGAVATIENPDDLYGIKCFLLEDEVARAVFNEGVRRSESLSMENEYFQSVYARYEDSCAYLMSDNKRQSLPACIQESDVFESEVAVKVAILLAQAMEFAHQHGFVNGNLKPANIIFENHDGVIKPVIYDFGQRLYVESYEQLSAAELPYIAPELEFNLQYTNAQADIFSFGMCLYYMLVGKSPYHTDTIDECADELVQEILECGILPGIWEERPDVPRDLIQIIEWCIEFDPARRYTKFSDVIRDLCVVYQKISCEL